MPLRGRTWPGVALAVALLAGGCARGEADERTVVASLYPLAFAAERISGPGWEVIDLTPPGAEAHDIELSLESRALIETADLVMYLGDLDFQPQVERAVQEADGEVLIVGDRGGVRESGDPHIWLWPTLFLTAVADAVRLALREADPGNGDTYASRFSELSADLEALQRRYDRALGGGTCAYRTMIVSHEAFAYLIRPYNLEQFGLAGLSPEGEPTHDRVAEAQRLIREGKAGAVFFEEGEDAERIARSVADDAGVPALPLSTLESQPARGDYLTVMEDNLQSLKEGLGCR